MNVCGGAMRDPASWSAVLVLGLALTSCVGKQPSFREPPPTLFRDATAARDGRSQPDAGCRCGSDRRLLPQRRRSSDDRPPHDRPGVRAYRSARHRSQPSLLAGAVPFIACSHRPARDARRSSYDDRRRRTARFRRSERDVLLAAASPDSVISSQHLTSTSC